MRTFEVIHRPIPDRRRTIHVEKAHRLAREKPDPLALAEIYLSGFDRPTMKRNGHAIKLQDVIRPAQRRAQSRRRGPGRAEGAVGVMAEIVWLSLDLPQGLSNLAAHARQEWRAACEDYRAQYARMCRDDKWHDWQELERLDALKERRKLAWDRWWKQRVGR